MKHLNFIKTTFAILTMVVVMACNKDDVSPTPPIDKETPTLEVVAGEKLDTELKFNITSNYVDEVAYIIVNSLEEPYTAEEVLTSGDKVEANNTVTVSVKNLEPGDTRSIVVCAKAGDDILTKTATNSTNAPTAKAIINGEYSATATTLTFVVETTGAHTAKYVCVEYDAAATAEEIANEARTNGTEIEVNKSVTVVVENLAPNTAYTFGVVAEDSTNYDFQHIKAETLTPALTAALTEDIGVDYVTFTATSSNVDGLRYVCFPKGEREVTDSQAYSNGTEIEANTENVVVKIDNLKDNTEYEIHVVGKAGDTYVSVALYPTTVKDIMVYNVVPNKASTYNGSGKNIFVTFDDEANGYQMKIDFYTSAEQNYLVSGEYMLKDNNPDYYYSPTYTALVVNSSTLVKVTDGTINVVATPNEDTREINYVIDAIFTHESNDYEIHFSYEGTIDGIELPVAIPDAPEGAIVFTPAQQPTRITGNEVPGEYYIKFYDNNWNELAIDLKLDPAICNDGNDPLPAGTYSMADGTIDPYTYVMIYNPSLNGKFNDAELIVERDGLTYTLTFTGTATDGTAEEVIFMYWTGEIKDMQK